MTPPRLSLWSLPSRLATAFRLLTFGPEDLSLGPHSPLVEVAWPGSCVCGLPVSHPRHGKAGRALERLRDAGKLPAPRQEGSAA